MTRPDGYACREYRSLSRRQFLSAGSGLAALAMSTPAWFPRVALGTPGANRDVLVSIYLRGGADGLTMCVPHGDADYYNLRPRLAIPRPGSGTDAAIDLDGYFGLPQALADLVQPYATGNLLIVHACSSTDRSRSHFEAQRLMEVGKENDLTVSTGWLGRHIATIDPANTEAALRAVGIQYGLPLTLEGGPRTLPIPDLDNFGLAGPGGSAARRLGFLTRMYDAHREPVRSAALNTTQTIALLDAIDFAGYQPAGGAVYPSDGQYFGYAMRSTAALVKAGVGVEAVHIDTGGWDTHAQQGIFQGTMADLMRALAGGLKAFHTDVLETGYRVTVVVMSEFGRRVQENSSSGTDHGRGGVMFCMGRNIDGGRVLSYWPGLADLDEGLDLRVTLDYRDILAEIVANRLGNADLGAVFPGYTPVFRGVTL